MITVKTESETILLKPTIFPDGTSQIWKLNPNILLGKVYTIVWNFESEREVIDLHSFMSLVRFTNKYNPIFQLHIPYLPYGRQDKPVTNESTFNLGVFGTLLNNLNFDFVTSIDSHNPEITSKLINNFHNIKASSVHKELISTIEPTFLVFPDKGAMERYGSELSHIPTIFCDKVRDQSTGQITGLKVNMPGGTHGSNFINRDRVLIVDDICDGGATFIGVAKSLREMNPNIQINLFVTHGIFSKGREHLLQNGIDEIYTTNSLLKNKDGFPV